MVPYVNSWSENFGKPPQSQREEKEEVEAEALIHRIEMPT